MRKIHWIILITLSAILHAWRLDVPREVVFDEVHYGKFVQAYTTTGERFFDIHPPLVKLLIAGSAKLFSFQGGFSFDHIGEPYGNIPVWGLRLVPMVSGILLPIFFAFLLLALGITPFTVFWISLAMSLENATLVETRFMLLDGYLILGILGTCLCCLKARSGSLLWTTMAALFAAMASLTKFTGLATFIAPTIWIIGFSVRRWVQISLFLIVSFVSILLVWKIHFAILPLPGPGDLFIKLQDRFFSDLFALHKEMLRANRSISIPHPDASAWWSWPFMIRPPFYWTHQSRFIYLVGNPWIWWSGISGLVLLCLHAVSRFKKPRCLDWSKDHLWYPTLLYVGSYLPLIPIGRPLFMYHYLPSLWLGIIVITVWGSQTGVFPKHAKLYFIMSALGFLLALPLTYGLSVPAIYLKFLYWRPEYWFN